MNIILTAVFPVPGCPCTSVNALPAAAAHASDWLGCNVYLSLYPSTYVYIEMYTYIFMYVYIYIYI